MSGKTHKSCDRQRSKLENQSETTKLFQKGQSDKLDKQKLVQIQKIRQEHIDLTETKEAHGHKYTRREEIVGHTSAGGNVKQDRREEDSSK